MFQALKFCGGCSARKKALRRRDQKKRKKTTIVLKELCIFDTNYQRKIDSQVHIIIMSHTVYYCLFHWLLAFLECKLLLVRVVHFFIFLFKISSTENALYYCSPTSHLPALLIIARYLTTSLTVEDKSQCREGCWCSEHWHTPGAGPFFWDLTNQNCHFHVGLGGGTVLSLTLSEMSGHGGVS